MPLFAVSDLGLALLVGATSLAGAAIGGLIAGFISLKVEERRQAFAAERDAERERRAASVGARLVWHELSWTSATLSQAIAKGGHWGHMHASTDAWEQHKEVLTAALTHDEWLTVAQAVTVTILLPDTYELNEPVGDEANLEAWLSAVQAGMDAVGRGMTDLARTTMAEPPTAEAS